MVYVLLWNIHRIWRRCYHFFVYSEKTTATMHLIYIHNRPSVFKKKMIRIIAMPAI